MFSVTKTITRKVYLDKQLFHFDKVIHVLIAEIPADLQAIYDSTQPILW